jgi:hypothetical protein
MSYLLGMGGDWISKTVFLAGFKVFFGKMIGEKAHLKKEYPQ